MRCEAKLAKRKATDWNAYAEQFQQLNALCGKIGKKRLLVEMLTQNIFGNLIRSEAKLAKVEAINWTFTQNRLSNLMRCEAKLAKRKAIDWNAYAEQFQQPNALCGKIGKKRLLIEMLTQNNFSNLIRCEAKLAKVEAINWTFTQNKLSNLMRCESKLAKRGYWLKCLRRTISATWFAVRQNWQK